MILDIGTLPITASIALFVVMFRPRWFKVMVDRVYSGKDID
jgi:hypothetical protein